MQAHLCSPLGVSKQLKLSSANEREGNTAIMMVTVRRVARISPSLVITPSHRFYWCVCFNLTANATVSPPGPSGLRAAINKQPSKEARARGNSMRLKSWQRLGIIVSVIWVAIVPTYFHLSQEDNARRIAGERYHLCIKQQTPATKAGIERCNKDLRWALAIARWSSWGQLALIPLFIAWLVGWGLLVLARRVRRRPHAISGRYPQSSSAEDNGEHREFVAPWTVEAMAGGFRVIDANGQSLAYVYGVDPRDATAKALTLDEARRIAANIAKLPKLLAKD